MNNLKVLRKIKNVTQSKIAKFLNVSVQAYSGYETEYRKLTPESLIKLADFFEVSIDYILGREDKHTAAPKSEIQTIYDSLTPGQQQRVLAYMYGFADANKDFEKLQKKS